MLKLYICVAKELREFELIPIYNVSACDFHFHYSGLIRQVGRAFASTVEDQWFYPWPSQRLNKRPNGPVMLTWFLPYTCIPL